MAYFLNEFGVPFIGSFLGGYFGSNAPYRGRGGYGPWYYGPGPYPPYWRHPYYPPYPPYRWNRR